MKKYYLMNKDNIVAEFSSYEYLSETAYKLESLSGRLPYGFKSIGNWLESRQAAKHRKHIKELMRQCGCETIEGFIRVLHCTSINDTFWVKGYNENINWREVSLYTNEFNEVVAKLAFEGVGLFGEKFPYTTAEFATGGAYQKCCTKGIDNEMYMYKRGTKGYVNAGLEPYCEAMASELYSIITKDSVKYELVNFHGKVASKCKIFSDESIGLVTYDMLGEGQLIPEMAKFYSEYNSESLFRNMLVADAVCFNEDRHLGNHGVIINNDTQEIIKMAPIYDYNIALLPYAMSSDFDDIDRYMAECTTRLGGDWVRVARAALMTETRSILINLKGYEFKFRGDEKFSLDRVKVIESMVNQQINHILGKGLTVGYTGISGWEKGKDCTGKTKAMINEGKGKT